MTDSVSRRHLLALAVIVVAGMLSACTDDTDPGATASVSADPQASLSGSVESFSAVATGAAVGGECAVPSFVEFDERLTTLPIGVVEPLPAPWLVQDDTGDPAGFHSALMNEVARRLGYLPEETSWVRTPRETIVAAGPKPFIVSPQPTALTSAERDLVDVTTPYFEAPKALITAGPDVAVTQLSDLAESSIAVLGDQQLALTIQEESGSAAVPETVSSADLAVRALKSEAAEVAVVDLPSAAEAVAADPDLRLVALLPPDRVPGDELSLILQKDSVFTQCFDDAVLLMTADGTLSRLVSDLLQPALPAVLQ